MEIKLDHIVKQFGRFPVIKDFSMTFENGKITSLLGPSGCGKSTLLNIIAGIMPPTSGNVFFDGRKVHERDRTEYSIGYIFQNYALYPNMTAFDNILFPLTNMKRGSMSRKKRKELDCQKVTDIASVLKIESFLKKYPSELSGGQQQRVAIGRALIKEPNLILMDEPFANLDKKLAEELRDEIREIQKKLKTTTIFVTHNQSDAAEFSDKIVVMQDGIVQQWGSSEQLYYTPRNLFVADFFGENGMNIIKAENTGDDSLFRPFFENPEVRRIAIRPENIEIVPPVPGQMSYCVDSIVRNSFYISAKIYCCGTYLKVCSSDVVHNGDTIGLRIRPNAVLLYDGEGNLIR